MPLRDAREHFERDYLEAQIERFGGNISKTGEFCRNGEIGLAPKIKVFRSSYVKTLRRGLV